MTTVTIPGLGVPDGIFVLGDGTRLFSTGDTILQLTPSDRLSTIPGNPLEEEGAFEDGQGSFARFNAPYGLTVDTTGNVVVADCDNHDIRSVAKQSSVVSTLVGGRQEDDEESDDENDDVEEGYADGHGGNARFNGPRPEGRGGGRQWRHICCNGEEGFTDGAGAAAPFNRPTNDWLRKIVGGQVTTLAGSSEPDTADGAGAVARFSGPNRLALDERGRLLVAESDREEGHVAGGGCRGEV